MLFPNGVPLLEREFLLSAGVYWQFEFYVEEESMNFTNCVRGTLTLADGAWGTELQKLGAPLGSTRPTNE